MNNPKEFIKSLFLFILSTFFFLEICLAEFLDKLSIVFLPDCQSRCSILEKYFMANDGCRDLCRSKLIWGLNQISSCYLLKLFEMDLSTYLSIIPIVLGIILIFRSIKTRQRKLKTVLLFLCLVLAVVQGLVFSGGLRYLRREFGYGIGDSAICYSYIDVKYDFEKKNFFLLPAGTMIERSKIEPMPIGLLGQKDDSLTNIAHEIMVKAFEQFQGHSRYGFIRVRGWTDSGKPQVELFFRNEENFGELGEAVHELIRDKTSEEEE